MEGTHAAKKQKENAIVQQGNHRPAWKASVKHNSKI